MTAEQDLEAFLLSVEWKDTPAGIELTLWARSNEHGPVRATVSRQEAVMFVPRSVETLDGRRESRPLRTLQGVDVDAVYFTSQRALLRERDRIRAAGDFAYESDLKPSNRFVMERFINGGIRLRGRTRVDAGVLRVFEPKVGPAAVTPKLKTLSLDIETDGWSGPVLSLAVAGCGVERVIHVRPGDSERARLEEAFALIRALDPDVLLGWNVVDFDLRALQTRCEVLGLPFALGRQSEPARVLIGSTPQSVSNARVPGRVVLDGGATLKNATWSLERYTLDAVAKALLGRGKLGAEGADPLAEIRRMYRDEPDALAAYNLEDARLALEIFEKADLVGFSVARA